MFIIFPIIVRLLQNNERSFPLNFTITVVEFQTQCENGGIVVNLRNVSQSCITLHNKGQYEVKRVLQI
jgi:hypothetical protein